jgi:alcohol dehydrogenase YqhD (iron-dependent ADH family)
MNRIIIADTTLCREEGTFSFKDKMEIARESIRRTAEFLFDTLGLSRTFTEVGIKREDFALMAKKACRYGDIKGFKTLTPADVERIFEMCL